MSITNKIKGVWVVGGIWEHKEFSLLEKHLFQKIVDLDNENGCTAMNGWFAEFLGVSKSRVSQLISGFKKNELIEVELKYRGKEVVGRVITVLKGGLLLVKEGSLLDNTPLSQTKDPPLVSSEDSNRDLSNRIEEYKETIKEKDKKILLLEKQIAKLKGSKIETDLKDIDFVEPFLEIANHFQDVTGKTVRIGKTTALILRSGKFKTIAPRLKAGATVEECKAVIELKNSQWKDSPKMKHSICIATLFRASNFEKYLDEIDNSQAKAPKEKKFPYKLPNFKSKEQRHMYFLARYSEYKPYLEQRLVNTTYRQRAIMEKDAEGLCWELELKQPELLNIELEFKT